MRALPTETEVLASLVAWAEARPAIRAVILTSSRARPGGPVDALSDYDIILAVDDAQRFASDEAWLSDYGEPMARWGDEGEALGVPTSFRSAVYQNYVKIDYTIWPEALLERLAQGPALPEELDEGYRVLLDKDGATAGWQPPTYRAFIPARPTEAEYLALIEEFWWVATYVAKSLWRDEIVFARWVLTGDLRDGALRRMLEWRAEIDHGWSVRPGVHGRGLQTLLPADTWAELAASYLGPGREHDWAALWRTAALFRRVAGEVASALGFNYPRATDDRASAFLSEIQRMPRDAAPL
jgi:aminoglycoside 6-adenylyltransferase